MNPVKQAKTTAMIAHGIRYVLFAGMLVGVYHETGLWTTSLLVILILELEFKAYFFKELTTSVQWLASIVVELVKAHQINQTTKENNHEDS